MYYGTGSMLTQEGALARGIIDTTKLHVHVHVHGYCSEMIINACAHVRVYTHTCTCMYMYTSTCLMLHTTTIIVNANLGLISMVMQSQVHWQYYASWDDQTIQGEPHLPALITLTTTTTRKRRVIIMRIERGICHPLHLLFLHHVHVQPSARLGFL